ncbi:MAG: hypothetical protein EOO43_24225 [Flavobacterium sp.]|nr:MAG: hypothetical protein EOO43_24225 [Flavobacterium sp.]
MKTTSILTLLALILFALTPIKAQNKVSAFISLQSELSFKVEKSSFSICISKKGDISGYSILANGTISYDIHGRIEKVGDVKISYDIHDRIDKIDNEQISYDIHNRLSQIGDTKISYDIHNRLESVGQQKVSYDIHGRVEKISLAKISYNYLGKIEKVEANQELIYLNIND